MSIPTIIVSHLVMMTIIMAFSIPLNILIIR